MSPLGGIFTAQGAPYVLAVCGVATLSAVAVLVIECWYHRKGEFYNDVYQHLVYDLLLILWRCFRLKMRRNLSTTIIPQ